MKTLTEIFESSPRTFSFELFPPKTEDGYTRLLDTIDSLCKLKPDFISCTYGAGGGSRDKTLDIVRYLQERHQIPGVHHFTCVLHTKDEIKQITRKIKEAGIRNILALRGDPPKDNPDWQPDTEHFKYSSELVQFLRSEYGDYFGIGVAGFPEGHLLCPDRDEDAKIMKKKIAAGADFVITQLFFDNKDYFDYVKRLKKLSMDTRVLPGILPITDYHALLRFTRMCGATIPPKVHNLFSPIADDKDQVLATGIQFAVEQCKELLAGGAPGIHFYCLNKVSPVDTILAAIRG